ISRQLEPELARFLDESEILVGQRQDRDFGEVDFLLARERKQKIERALESLDVDHERRFLARPLGHKIALQLDVVGHEIALRAVAPALTSAANSARSAARSSLTTCPRRPSAASARAAALPVSTGTALATACISAMSPLQCSTTSHPAAMAARARVSIEPDKAPMGYRRSSAGRQTPATRESRPGSE